jgi:hypothetical protein
LDSSVFVVVVVVAGQFGCKFALRPSFVFFKH